MSSKKKKHHVSHNLICANYKISLSTLIYIYYLLRYWRNLFRKPCTDFTTCQLTIVQTELQPQNPHKYPAFLTKTMTKITVCLYSDPQKEPLQLILGITKNDHMKVCIFYGLGRKLLPFLLPDWFTQFNSCQR